MKYSKDEVIEYTREEDVKFIRLSFCDVFGRQKNIPVDVRIIAATNQPLEKMIREKQFRMDLYYRLSTLRIDIPPLRERGYDVVLMAEHFIRAISKRIGKEQIMSLSDEAKALLLQLPWMGNARELQNLFERIVQITDNYCGRINPEVFLSNRNE